MSQDVSEEVRSGDSPLKEEPSRKPTIFDPF